MHMTNSEVAQLLRSVATAYKLTLPNESTNRFRIIAYEKAADTIDRLSQQLYDIWESTGLQGISAIHGIGPTLSQHIDEYFKKKENSYLSRQLSLVPLSVYELMKVPGIGPKKAFILVSHFLLNDEKSVVDKVKKLAKHNQISMLEGFGEKSQTDILQSIKIFEERGRQERRMTLPVAMGIAEQIVAYLYTHPLVEHVEVLGSLRRMSPTIGDIDLAVVCKPGSGSEVVMYFITYPHKILVDAQGVSKASITVAGGIKIDMRIVPRDIYGSMLQHNTGSKNHNIQLREYALKKGYSLSEFGIKNTTTSEVHTFDKEDEFYSFLGLQYIPPEIREGNNEIKSAQKNCLPALVTLEDIKGDFHVHSSFDVVPSHDLGKNSFKDMLKVIKKIGFSYVGFSEHNPAVLRLKEDEIVKIMISKRNAIHKIQNQTRIKVFNGLEVDIRPDGSLALPDNAYNYLDYIIVSIHSSFRMSKSSMTKRILKALSYPKVRILGHPTGRLLMRREEIDVDWDAIFKEAKKRNIALEINAWPDRLDLPDILVRRAVDNHNILTINTDAHSSDELYMMRYGVAVARRGWATKNAIINTRSITDINSWIHS